MTVTRKRAGRGAIALLGLAFVAASCSAGASPASSGDPAGAQPSSPPTTAGGSPSVAASLPTTGHLGVPLGLEDGNGHDLSVTLVKVFDPASVTPDNVAAAKAAKSRWVGVELSIVDLDAAEPGQTLRVDGTGSDGSHLDPDATAYSIGLFAECTPTTEDLPIGQAYTTCAGFMVPTGVTVASVGYTAAATGGQVQADQVTWTVP